MSSVRIIGAGVAGLVAATQLVASGARVEIVERANGVGEAACSWCAGGMLAPWCEGESAEKSIVTDGQLALDWWPRHFSGTEQHGTLVLAPARDSGEIARFARRTTDYQWQDGAQIAALEPDLAGRFDSGLFFAREAHLDPRAALLHLHDSLKAAGVRFVFGVDAQPDDALIGVDYALDCRGFAARPQLANLRGVRGEMLIVRTHEIKLSRPIRLLHPRIPLYVVPRADGLFLIGATMIESEHRGPVTVRSAIELMNAAFTLHPCFGEAEIVEMRADVRPAYPDNLPRVTQDGRVISLNGLYRHGFLMSPTLAMAATRLVEPALT